MRESVRNGIIKSLRVRVKDSEQEITKCHAVIQIRLDVVTQCQDLIRELNAGRPKQ